MLTPVILSGGAGTRLWPLSRELYPKQLLPLTGDRPLSEDLVQEAFVRVAAKLHVLRDPSAFTPESAGAKGSILRPSMAATAWPSLSR